MRRSAMIPSSACKSLSPRRTQRKAAKGAKEISVERGRELLRATSGVPGELGTQASDM